MIQISKFNISSFDMIMLLTTFHLQNRDFCALELPCGLITPTLPDIVAITTLKLLGEQYTISAFKVNHDLYDDIDWRQKVYNYFIFNNNSGNDSSIIVFKVDYVAFLTFWLTSQVFCSKQIQVTSSYYHLTQISHFSK